MGGQVAGQQLCNSGRLRKIGLVGWPLVGICVRPSSPGTDILGRSELELSKLASRSGLACR